MGDSDRKRELSKELWPTLSRGNEKKRDEGESIKLKISRPNYLTAKGVPTYIWSVRQKISIRQKKGRGLL